MVEEPLAGHGRHVKEVLEEEIPGGVFKVEHISMGK
jgi:hypothetical protein